jgi:hypothetical protein
MFHFDFRGTLPPLLHTTQSIILGYPGEQILLKQPCRNLGAWGLALWEKDAGRLVLPVQGVQNEIFGPSNSWDACFGITCRLRPPRD